ncbi:hypothetical protein [Mesorhizobium sp. M7A.F.Ca.CA.002.12.1.1]|uniref:hypothetical protein n=1 Tax=Mesorhizobium sp. M7A.F.Ca.CA.002.12.1.1 TaxID=2496735 RepID=UPI000FCBE856|nr:hypothetical protein [Mesorhizobium sp. M7A.F.Ca.CA.002.12.1.1]RUX60163.1 hypothetical protein EN989_11140 [Mesorhizobium sp. M7A.F.Ca.CA.002.12.1.1]
MTTEAQKDYLGMSDEDFLNAPMPVAAAEEPAAQVETPVEGTVENQEETPGSDVSAAVETEDTDENKEKEEDADAPEVDADGKPVAKPGDETSVPGSAAAAGDSADPKGEVDADGKPKVAAAADLKDKKVEPKADEKPVDYEAFYKQILTPFKANGRTIELKTPEEAIRLMQMGAGYGRKIQDMQPHLKVLRMLEKNDLLDEGKLSFLIDINSKNPDAIKKIIKEAGIDPIDLNINDNVPYIPQNHSVSDDEMRFQEALGEIQSHPTGQDTLREINQKWDQESKTLLWKEPQLLSVIQSQRDTGVYDQITAEIDRQKLLGQIPNSTPFLQAYKLAGDHLQANNGFKPPQIQTQPGVTQQPQVIATRTAAPKAQVANGDKAAAASITKTTPRKAATTVNPLQMADDEFLKQFNGRL